jgi:hypothetical protein
MRCEHNTFGFSIAEDGSWHFPNPKVIAADRGDGKVLTISSTLIPLYPRHHSYLRRQKRSAVVPR